MRGYYSFVRDAAKDFGVLLYLLSITLTVAEILICAAYGGISPLQRIGQSD